ncbi:YpoC family protein [Ectobacillus panaciterrae]|uniref:YpoC family protein n=1 Tax=Ectobacillus panaciterrae TaxID=363872 RepID=UPI000413B54F|nr:hypothetical protein [Ectobacillus panaciterrae]
MIKLDIPAAFRQPPFFVKEETIVYEETETLEQAAGKEYFLYELAKLQGLDAYEPWQDQEHAIPVMIEVWKEERDGIASLFRERRRTEAEKPTVRFSAHFLSALYWLNDERLTSLENIEQQLTALKIKPVNVSERLGFVLNQPGHYHSFIQLTQLYEEFEKLFVKEMLIQKRPSR